MVKRVEENHEDKFTHFTRCSARRRDELGRLWWFT
jgi:hypothetical protein